MLYARVNSSNCYLLFYITHQLRECYVLTNIFSLKFGGRMKRLAFARAELGFSFRFAFISFRFAESKLLFEGISNSLANVLVE